MAQYCPKLAECRKEVFDSILDDCRISSLKVTEGPEGLGLAVCKSLSAGDELYNCSALRIHEHSQACRELEDFCFSLTHPRFLPASCYCAALSSLSFSQLEGKLEGFETDINAGCQQSLLALSRPARVALRAPGMTPSDDGVEDATAHAILQHYQLPHGLLLPFVELAKVWRYNAFAAGDDRMAVFLLPSLCNHSCNPSVDYALDLDVDGKVTMSLVASRALAAGDCVTISYIEQTAATEPSRLARRKTLAEGWLFLCCCEACTASMCGLCSCGEKMELWISDLHGGPYEDSGEAPTCDVCGEVDLVVSGPYFFHCKDCEADVCAACAASCSSEPDGDGKEPIESSGQ
ncbi:unnamed protein product [Effrenium voratum]|uniref:SET domain-containing protein n=1 Tax=Effrenium voratum TaxID=2562239 RepID=A0AA36JI76_9DINO|nr:unnamed protein product [Effrenium voratum]